MYIAIDFDGTIVKHAYPKIGEPVPHAFEWMKRFRELGAKLILWTMRSDTDSHGYLLSEAVDFCRKNGIEFDFVNEHPQRWTTSPKVYADLYIDDSAVGCPLLSIDADQKGKPYVDWNQVGPQVVDSLQARRNQALASPAWW